MNYASWEKNTAIRNEVYGPYGPNRDNSKLVSNMAKSILTGGGKNQKFTLKCPTARADLAHDGER